MLLEELTPDQALALHRQFLQEVLAEVMHIFSSGTASDERLSRGLETYWEACLARREQRRTVMEATSGSPAEFAVEPMGKPFLMMVRAELLPRRGKASDGMALTVYDEARAIAVSEALTGQRETARRRSLIQAICG